MPTFKSNTLVFVLAVLCVVLIFLNIRSCNNAKKDKENGTNLVNALNDSLHKKNDSTVSTSVIATNTIKDFLELEVRDAEIRELQSTVKQYKSKLKAGSSVTNFKSEVEITNTNTTKISMTDTVRTDSIVYLYPTYSDSIKNEWIDYKAKMNKDSATLFLKVNNSYSTIIGVEKGKPFVDIINHNPYSITTSVRSYQVQLPKPKKFGLGFSAGATYYNNKAQPYIGAGLNYNILSF